MNKNDIIKIYGTDYKDMTICLLKQAGLAGLIPRPAKKIGIKPNLVTPTPASFGATTHPEIVAGIIEYLRDHGDYDIIIAEGSWVGDKTSEAFEYCGYNDLKNKYDVTLLDTQKDREFRSEIDHNTLSELTESKLTDGILRSSRPRTHSKNSFSNLNICSCVNDFDFLINVPVLKGHCQTKITCALKNMKGLIPNSEKRRFHTLGLHKPIAYLNKCIKQDFIVVDHICGDLEFEEGGNPVTSNCIMAAEDPVLLDSYVCALLGYQIPDVPYIGYAEKLGIGDADLENLNVYTMCSDNTGGMSASAFREDNRSKRTDAGIHTASAVPGYSLYKNYDPELSLSSGRRMLDVSYAVDEIDSCSACYGVLIPALSRLKEEGFLKKLETPIAIGQGHRGLKGRLGVGDCTSDFDICIHGCPPSEQDIYNQLKELLSRI